MIPRASPGTHARWARHRAAVAAMRQHLVPGAKFAPEDVISALCLAEAGGNAGDRADRIEGAVVAYDLELQFGPKRKNNKPQRYVLDLVRIGKSISKHEKHLDLDLNYLLGLRWTPTPRGFALIYVPQIGFPVQEEGW